MWHCTCFLFGFLPVAAALSYNDCERTRGPPDPGTVPVWNGVLETFFDDYRPLSDIDKFVTQLQATYPGYVTLTQIGTSWEKRPLRVMEITSGGAAAVATKPAIYLQGGIHAREWIATSAVLNIAYNLVTQAANPVAPSHIVVADMLNKYVFLIISPINPDGYEFTWTTDRFWRKTRSSRETCATAPGGIAGVDPNRNWGYTRGIYAHTAYAETPADMVNPCVETYEGPEAESEPEVKAVVNYLRQRQTKSFQTSTKGAFGQTVPGPGYVTALIDYHSYCMFLLPPWGYSAVWPSAPDSQYMQTLGSAMVDAIKGSSGRLFRLGPDLLPADPGTAPDWAYGELGIRATMTMELEGNEETSSFCIGKERIKSVGAEQFQAVIAMVGHFQSQGDYPSKLFGLWAGSPPAPPIAPAPARLIRKWLTTASLWSGRSRYGYGIIVACTAFVVGLSLLGISFMRRRVTDREIVRSCPEECIE